MEMEIEMKSTYPCTSLLNCCHCKVNAKGEPQRLD